MLAWTQALVVKEIVNSFRNYLFFFIFYFSSTKYSYSCPTIFVAYGPMYWGKHVIQTYIQTHSGPNPPTHTPRPQKKSIFLFGKQFTAYEKNLSLAMIIFKI